MAIFYLGECFGERLIHFAPVNLSFTSNKHHASANLIKFVLSPTKNAGSVAVTSKKKKGKGGNRGKKGRLTEAEEDAQLLKSAQSKRRTIRLDHQPSNLASHCKMHPYQLEGLNWLIKLHDHGINGILADEMGLGKTLQTISLLAYLRESRGVKGPHLVVVPKSVVGNWCRELKKWCPVIKVVKLLGSKDQRKQVVADHLKLNDGGKVNFDVLVTSYEGILKEKSSIGKLDWKYRKFKQFFQLI